MNKYSKRALKTTATVGMSLAMVLSGVAAPLTNVNVVKAAVCDYTLASQAATLISAIQSDLDSDTNDYRLGSMPYDGTISAWTSTIAMIPTVVATDKIDTLLVKPTTVVKTAAILDGGGNITTAATYYTAQELLVILADCGSGAKYEEAVTLVGHKDDATRELFGARVQSLEAALTTLENDFKVGGQFDSGIIPSVNYTAVKADYDFISDFYSKLADNMVGSGSVTKADLKNYYRNYFSDMDSAVTNYQEENLTPTVLTYVTALENEKVAGITVKTLIDDETQAFSYDDLDKLTKFISDLKDNKNSTLSAIAKYSVVAENAKVDKYVSGLETMVEEIKTVKELISPSNDLTVAYKRGVSAKVNTLGSMAALLNVANPATGAQGRYDTAFNKFRADDITVLVDYVEGVVNEFYTVNVRNGRNGIVYLELKDAGLARYINEADVVSSALKQILTINLENTNEDSVYDELTTNVTSLEELIKACTTDISGLTLNSKITDKEALKIVAAKTAYDELMGAGSAYTMTAKEKAAVKANGVLINALYTKLIYNGTVISTGWVDKGNGNWDFFNNDGTAATKWVAAGTDWYYVKSGAMLRNSWVANDATGSKWYYVDDAGKMVSNTTVNGYAFDANGVWVK